MTAKKPLVLSSGQVAELAAGDTLDRAAMLSALSWAGQFPFAAGGSDATIAADTDLTDTGRYKQYRNLTVSAGIKLRCRRTPFFLFADTINFGSSTSEIGCDGPQPTAASTPTYGANFARGGFASGAGCGGCGGGILVVCARVLTGSAGKITARGSNGYSAGTTSAGGYGGQGALSTSYNLTSTPEDFTTSFLGLPPLWFLRAGGDHGSTSKQGKVGGAGGGAVGTSAAGGGSGLGGGGVGTGAAPTTVDYYPTAEQLLWLASIGCLGGGGGGLVSFSGLAANAGGGGGGAVLVFAQQWDITPTTVVTGGTNSSGVASGADGFALLVKV